MRLLFHGSTTSRPHHTRTAEEEDSLENVGGLAHGVGQGQRLHHALEGHGLGALYELIKERVCKWIMRPLDVHVQQDPVASLTLTSGLIRCFSALKIRKSADTRAMYPKVSSDTSSDMEENCRRVCVCVCVCVCVYMVRPPDRLI